MCPVLYLCCLLSVCLHKLYFCCQLRCRPVCFITLCCTHSVPDDWVCRRVGGLQLTSSAAVSNDSHLYKDSLRV